jgi:hypothetical protein
MSASVNNNNNNNNNNNKEQKESEVEAAIGRADERGGDSPRERGLPATVTRDLETAQSEGDVVATQLDGLAREQEDNEESSSEESGPSSEGSGSLRYLLDASCSRLGNGYGYDRWSEARDQAKLELHGHVVRAVWQ